MKVELTSLRAGVRTEALDLLRRDPIQHTTRLRALVDYWERLARRTAELDDAARAGELVAALRKDIDTLRAIRQGAGPDTASWEQLSAGPMRQLERSLTRLERHWWRLRRRQQAYFASLNPAFPRTSAARAQQEEGAGGAGGNGTGDPEDDGATS